MKLKFVFLILSALFLLNVAACGGGNGSDAVVDGGVIDNGGGNSAGDDAVTDGSDAGDSASGGDASAVSLSSALVDSAGNPVSGAGISIAVGGAVVSTAVTDSDGKGSLNVDVQTESAYLVSIVAEGYVTQTVEFVTIAQLQEFFSKPVALEKTVLDFNFTAEIIDSESAGIAGAVITISSPLAGSFLFTTDANGIANCDFSIPSNAGTLTVVIEAFGFNQIVLTVTDLSALADLIKQISLTKIDVTLNDSNSDQTGDSSFDYSTIKILNFELKVVDVLANVVSGVKITITDNSGEVIAQVLTGDDGKAVFSGAIVKTSEFIRITLDHQDYVERTEDIANANFVNLESVIRTMGLERKQIIVPDTDGDGFNDDVEKNVDEALKDLGITDVDAATDPSVPDADGDSIPDFEFTGNVLGVDAEPADSTISFTTKGSYTFAFEDLYPKKGDADFNDLVVRLSYYEYTGTDNVVRKIRIFCKPLAAGAGYDNKLAVRIAGTDYTLISSTKALFGSVTNTSAKNTTYTDVCSASLAGMNPDMKYIALDDTSSSYPGEYKLELVVSIPKKDIAALPYDPYLVPNQVASREIHLPFVATTYTGAVLDSDNFPWAVVVPKTWLWPYEGDQGIFNAYPKFKTWYQSEGASDVDWYNYPVAGKVYPASL